MPYLKREPSRRDRWKVKVGRTQTVPAAARLFLVTVLAPKMSADGKVSVPRKRLAAAAGVSERRVTMFITQAKEAGWLVVVQAGYRTMTAEYQASFPDYESGNTVFSHSEPESGNETDPHCAGTLCSPITPGKREHSVPTTSSSTTRRLQVVGTDRNVSHLPGSPLSRRRVFGFGINESRRDQRTSCRTVARTVERHRPGTMDAAQVETNPSGADPATRFDCLKTRPRAEVRPMTNPRAAIQDATTRRAG